MNEDQIMMAAFRDEVQEIVKEAGVLSFLRGGARHVGKAFRVAGPKGAKLSWTRRLGGAGAERAGGLGKHVSQIYGAGAAKAERLGRGKLMGGVGALARSRYGQMAGMAGVGGAGLYGAGKMVGLGGGQRRR